MNLTKKFSLVTLSNNPRVIKQRAASSQEQTIINQVKKSLTPVASRVGSQLSLERRGSAINFYLNKRPKDRSGRVDWDEKTERIADSCNSRYDNVSASIVPARNGNELEISLKH